MSTLNFIITDAGRQAAINADVTGVQLTLTEVGYGTGNWSPDKTATALQSEFKRLPAGGGDNPAPLYVHIAVTDQSSDTYQGNEVAVYAGNVLFAIWSKGLQPDTVGPGKISSGDSAFIFDLLLDNIPSESVTVGDANFSAPLATETKPGIIPEASQQEVEAYSGNGAIIPPKLKIWFDKVKQAFALKQHDHNVSNIIGLGSAAKYNVGDSVGQVALIGDPASTGKAAVIVASGSNSNGEYIIYSNGLKKMWLGQIALPAGTSTQYLPIALNSRILDVTITDNTGVTGIRGWDKSNSTLNYIRVKTSLASGDSVDSITVTGY